jgi:hypothetical protein
MIDKILSGVVDDAADKAVARERRRLARLGIVEGTKMYHPVAETVELEHAATCVCVARFEDDEAERAERATGDARTAREARATRETEDDEDENATSTSTSRPRVVVFAGDEDGCVLAGRRGDGRGARSRRGVPGAGHRGRHRRDRRAAAARGRNLLARE